MIHTVTTALVAAGWFAALAPVRVYNDTEGATIWATTLAVWLASRRLLRAVTARRVR